MSSAELAADRDSHLVWFAFSFGCETSRCQTTAWNASECGVTLSGIDGRHDDAGVGDLARCSRRRGRRCPMIFGADLLGVAAAPSRDWG